MIIFNRLSHFNTSPEYIFVIGETVHKRVITAGNTQNYSLNCVKFSVNLKK